MANNGDARVVGGGCGEQPRSQELGDFDDRFEPGGAGGCRLGERI
jgi:hypothetical protein